MELFFTTAALFIITVAASLIFYKRIKMAQSEYEESKNKVHTITHGFTKQVNRIEKSFNTIEKNAAEARYNAMRAIKKYEEVNEITLNNVKEIDTLSKSFNLTKEDVKKLKEKIVKISEMQKPYTPTDTEIEAAIPVHKEDVLEQLTDTEIDTLIIIEELGEGTVPKIKNKINKTREHTARTLKKLYDKGYVDRNTNSMPYRYTIRPEIKEFILQKKNELQVKI